MDKRKNTRLPLKLSGHLSLEDGQYHETETQDISLGGARVDFVSGDSSERSCVLTLFAEGEDVFSVTIDGWVVYEDGRGCGVAFQSMDKRDFAAFKEFIERQTRDPESIRKEVAQGKIPELKDWVIS
ncbi:type IV pilus assembly PilZ [Thioalkalivibrio nitratireducens DSM 14787]|uniref:Type IV pilus assembly PilZ n=1 Tax=Thioalkalivibrio nitratireducens (strain DSM 14787 / UNIQEM 213 / ALEN2) TaxID=1255043 RepID=L0DQT0_THIND|nr:PilZ domain-containing protein [Thioalkalivibrio nitratireducens]AGA31869.1 type IV pilus assembly PilZ [Thioalkalivibrio nitratireducens DSM 14787]